MSVKIAQLNALIEKVGESMNPYYENRVVTITSFAGGMKRGKSLQISFIDDNLRDVHFQLDNGNIQLLKQILNKHF